MLSKAGKISTRKQRFHGRKHLELDEHILTLKKYILHQDHYNAVRLVRLLPDPIPWDTHIYEYYFHVYKYKSFINNYIRKHNL